MNDQLTIKDIARLSGVGISTVSRVLNGRPDVGTATRSRVMEVVMREGYTPNGNAKHLKQKSTDYIAAIVCGTQNLFLSAIAERLQRYVEAAGYRLLLNYVDERDDVFSAAVRLQHERKAQGIIFVGGDPYGHEGELGLLGVPGVFATCNASSIGLPHVYSVSVDDRAGARQAMDYLLDNGHRKIVVLGGTLEKANTVGLRFEGVRESFESHGLCFDPRDYIGCHFTFQSACDAIRAAFDRGCGYTAVFAASDIMAIGAAKALAERGLRIPEDVSICGFDGTELARFYNPTLATVKQPADELARVSVQLLTQGLRQETGERHVTLSTRLVPGGSVQRVTPQP